MNYTPNRIHEHLSASLEFGELYSKMIEAKEFLIEIGYSNITPNFILDRLQNNYDCSETMHTRNKNALCGVSLNMVKFLNGVVFFLGDSNPVVAARANELINQLDSFCHFEDLGLTIRHERGAQYRPFIQGQPLSQFLSQLPLPPPPRAGVTPPQRVPLTVRRYPQQIDRVMPPPPSTFPPRPPDGDTPPSDGDTTPKHFRGGKRRKTGKQRKSGKRRKTGKQRKSRKH
jgi:hypothetical protein